MTDSQKVWYTISVDDVLADLQTAVDDGLSESDIDQRREQYGTNELEDSGSNHPARIFWEQISDTMVLILIAAAVITFILQIVAIYTPFLKEFFHVTPLNLNQFLICLAIGFGTFFAIEIEKWWMCKD